jgi:hypothetical protein
MTDTELADAHAEGHPSLLVYEQAVVPADGVNPSDDG